MVIISGVSLMNCLTSYPGFLAQVCLVALEREMQGIDVMECLSLVSWELEDARPSCGERPELYIKASSDIMAVALFQNQKSFGVSCTPSTLLSGFPHCFA